MNEEKPIIKAKNVYYIKLGEKGNQEEYCIDNNLIYIGYGDVLTKENHLEIGYNYDKIQNAFLTLEKT